VHLHAQQIGVDDGTALLAVGLEAAHKVPIRLSRHVTANISTHTTQRHLLQQQIQRVELSAKMCCLSTHIKSVSMCVYVHVMPN
jgi:hypothetical protein